MAGSPSGRAEKDSAFFLCQTTPTQVASAKLTHPFHSGPPSLALTGAVGCMIAAMGSWRRKAATSGHNHTNTDLHGDWSPVVRLGLPIWAADRTWVFAGSEFSECSVCDVSALPQRSDTAAVILPSCPQLCRPRYRLADLEGQLNSCQMLCIPPLTCSPNYLLGCV